MTASGTVAAGDLATATQYNNLRTDVVDTSSGHKHDGTDSTPIAVDYFGDGNDGDVTGSGTLTRAMFYNNLTVNGDLIANGYPIFVKGTLTINSSCFISCNGGNYSGSSGGTAGGTVTGYYVPGTNGGNAGSAGANRTNSLGGNGGAGSVNNGGTAFAPNLMPRTPLAALILASQSSGTPAAAQYGGGCGGGTPAAAYGAGGGGGVIVIFARNIVNNGTIRANGGTGGTSAGGGGGGGIVIVYRTATWGTEQANGGTGGNASGSAGNVIKIKG